MRKSQAQKLKAGQRVVWRSPGGNAEGVVTRKRYNTVWIQWDNQPTVTTYYAEAMDHIYTPEQWAAEQEQERIGRLVMEESRRRMGKSSGP
jgi:hypothetical protein